MSGVNLQSVYSSESQYADQQLMMTSLRGSAMEHQRYAEQQYSDLFHQPFQRLSPDHDCNSMQNHTYPISVSQSHTTQSTQNHSFNLNQDHLPPQPRCPDLTDTRMMHMNQIDQIQQITQPVPNMNHDPFFPQRSCEPLIDNRPNDNHQNHQVPQTQSPPNGINLDSNTNQYNRLLVPQPQHSSATTNIGSVLVHAESHTVSQVTNSNQHTASGKQVSQKTKKSSRSKQRIQTSKDSSLTDQPNREKDSLSSIKSSKAAVDAFLLPSSRLPKDIDLPEQLTVEQLYKLQASQLRKLADKHSTGPGRGVMSEAKKKVLREFHTSTEKLQAILCIHLGISQEVASSEIGRFASHRLPIAYNYFKKTKEVRQIYREHGGATNKLANALVKNLWDALSSEEKEAYLPNEAESDTEETDIPGNNDDDGVNPDEIPDHRPTQTGLATIVRGSNDEVTRKNGFRTSSRNLAFSKAKCTEFVATFIKKANNMSRLHPVQFAIVAISTHLSDHCFQFITTTPGLWEWAEHDLSTSATRESTTSRMQAFVTGRSVAGLARPKRPKGSTVEVDKLKAHLNNIIRKATNKPQETWKWSNCETRLADEGFDLKYEPSDSAYKLWITKPNCSLTEEKARRLNLDLISHPVSLIPIENFVPKYKSGQNKKRKIDSEFENKQDGQDKLENVISSDI